MIEEKCLQVHEVMREKVQTALDTLGRRWTGEVLAAGILGARRYGEYRRAIGGVSDRMLTVRLRELETLGLLTRTVVPTSPVQVLYTPTRRGIELMSAIKPLVAWGKQA
ncbi:helix-turn-helix transcriptional regulator [Actinoplanes sp. TBRC 11911]|uniref:winged helix-turn-helix transcriptional regulator n=1 Tax=Actinoplanes sp. TBRC 11911 TaxID=2729386 RepID=UPI00145DFE49|nr:helix-turn-helix domain-containing protein [Actinoplanes sp. TBRC 11911]NMO52341.1 helix-turn-helix transcriptional regulator [Actinoplanes sp. TBRC 11911]